MDRAISCITARFPGIGMPSVPIEGITADYFCPLTNIALVIHDRQEPWAQEKRGYITIIKGNLADVDKLPLFLKSVHPEISVVTFSDVLKAIDYEYAKDILRDLKRDIQPLQKFTLSRDQVSDYTRLKEKITSWLKDNGYSNDYGLATCTFDHYSNKYMIDMGKKYPPREIDELKASLTDSTPSKIF